MIRLRIHAVLFAAACAAFPSLASVETLENRLLRVELDTSEASVRLVDKRTGAAWALGTAHLAHQGSSSLSAGGLQKVLSKTGNVLSFTTTGGLALRLELDASSLTYSFEPRADVEVRLLNDALALPPGKDNYYAVPQRLGVLLQAEGDRPFRRTLTGYRGYSMAMFGAVKEGSALLASWEDPYTDIELSYSGAPARRLAMSLVCRQSAHAVRLQPLGRGGYAEIAKAYRPVARERGILRTLEEKLRRNPRIAELFGAADFKPFAFMRRMPGTRLNKTDKPIFEINFSFDECADMADHLRNDLGIDRAMLVLNGWINAGYDNRHPDVLPAAPQIGGDEGLARCSRRVKALPWLFGLHDNYQDMYQDAPSWNEEYIMKNADGSLRKGGIWPGGQCWLICSKKALELAQRPQNIPGIKKLFAPTIFFADTIFAAPPYECFDPKHPLTLNDDIANKKKLCDYLRGQFGLFGSEDGREWAVPHADYFEGLLSHKTRFTYWGTRPPHDDIVIPLFHLVYGDAIQVYAHQSDRPTPANPSYILDHILYAEMPVYHFGNHRYWTDRAQDFKPEPGSEKRLVYARGGRFGLVDQFIKNTYEILSPLNRLTALLPMTDHEFLTPDRKVERTRFGNDVRITVNYGATDFHAGNAVLPQWGFLVEGPRLTAFYARRYLGVSYRDPPLMVLQSGDGKPLWISKQIRTYHAFGDDVQADRVVSLLKPAEGKMQ